jgi:putative membrane protein
MGGALLALQAAITVCWLVGAYGRRGALTALPIFVLAWGVEHLGVATGLPFGRYRYTPQLGPRLLGVVPLAIPCAWLMVATGAYQVGGWVVGWRSAGRDSADCQRSGLLHWGSVATLVVLLDLQIEPVSTAINRYWVWLDGGAYYGVPAGNFAAWWIVGLGMAIVMTWSLGGARGADGAFGSQPAPAAKRGRALWPASAGRYVADRIPAWLYLLNTLMFSVINLAWGYLLAGLVGVAVLLAAALATYIVVSGSSVRSQRTQRGERGADDLPAV